ncbi:hypothetical protein ES703_111724 [subsurface metagenome]
MQHKYKAKCSQCGRRFFAETRKELLDKLRKHMWLRHADWMKRRIKAGLRKRKQSIGSNPSVLSSILAGVFPPANIPAIVSQYRGMSPAERTLSKTLVASLTVPIGPEASAVAAIVMRALDMAVKGA